MPEGVKTSLYADDLALSAQGVDLADIKARMQTALDQLATWAECWKMQINVEKTVTTFFTTEATQSRWRPELTVSAQLLICFARNEVGMQSSDHAQPLQRLRP
ncbi:hypothetical protein AAVH_30294, partial [Aphelenchoides avenae]